MRSPNRQGSEAYDDTIVPGIFNEHGVRINEPSQAEKLATIHEQLKNQTSKKPPFFIADVMSKNIMNNPNLSF